MSDQKQLELEREKILYRKVVVPNLQRWFKSREHTIGHPDGRDKLVKYLKFDYRIKHEAITLVLITEGDVKTYEERWRFSNHLKKHKPQDRHQATTGQPSTALEWYQRVATIRSLAHDHTSYNRDELLMVLDVAKAIPEFHQLAAEIDLDLEVQKNIKQQQKLREYSRKKRAVTFTASEQKKIAGMLVNLISEKTENYLLKLLLSRKGDGKEVGDIDLTGQSLLDAMSIFNIERDDIISSLLNHPRIEVRRFAAVFANNNTAALIDTDPRVRVAAKARRGLPVRGQEGS